MAAPPTFSPGFQADLQTLFQWRRDVRAFRPDPIPADLLHQLLDTAALAPSVGLSQPWRFVLVDDAARRAAIRALFAAANARALRAQPPGRQALYASLKLAGLDQAPTHLAVFAEPDPARGHGLGRATMPETAAYSAVLAIHTLWLAARAHGLGLGWVSILDADAVGRALDTPAEWRFVAYLCVGHPAAADDTPELQRRGWEQRAPGQSPLQR